MTTWQAIIKGLVQGLTEFLPVSSSAHLVFTDHFLQLHQSEQAVVSFDVLVHLGTLLAVLVYFRTDVWLLLRGFGRTFTGPARAWREDGYTRLAWLMVLGTIPAGVAVALFGDFFEASFKNVPGTALFLLVTAAMLFFISRYRTGERTIEHSTWKDALLIGAFQAFAILPGVSRSGSTITAGLLRGLDRDSAPRFSFLLSIPVILAGGLMDAKDIVGHGLVLGVGPMIGGFLAAAVSGYLAVVLLLGIVRKGRLDAFAAYCVVVGVGMFAYWQLCVPQVSLNSALAISGQDVAAVYRNGELDSVALGQQVRLRITAQPGRLAIPITEVRAIVEPADEHEQPQTLRFLPMAGVGVFESEVKDVKALAGELAGQVYKNPTDGAVREIRVIVRNEWGIEREVSLKIRVRPEAEKDRQV